MKSQLLNRNGERVFVVVFERDEEVVKGLTDFARDQQLHGSQLSAIGAFRDVVLGYFDRDRKQYRKIPVQEQVEVLSLIGNITRTDDAWKLHAHVVIGRAEGAASGGHLLEAHVWPTLEVMVTESPKHLQRQTDPDTGLALIRIPVTA